MLIGGTFVDFARRSTANGSRRNWWRNGLWGKVNPIREDKNMPALDVEKDVFTFDELSDEAKETPREWLRECQAGDFDTEFQFEDFQRAAAILGIEFDTREIPLHGGGKRTEPAIYYSGFRHQGSGASFTGWYHNKPGVSANIREVYPTETTLHEIADSLQALQVAYRLESGRFIEARIRQDRSNYSYEYSMDISASDSETGEEFDFDGHHVKTITEAMRDFARWMYKSLEEEYDYQMSDESIDDTIRANEYEFEFDEDGERI
jgi:hypothetical protein